MANNGLSPYALMSGIKPAHIGKYVWASSGMLNAVDDVVDGSSRDAKPDLYVQLVAITCGRAKRYVLWKTSCKLELKVSDSEMVEHSSHRIVGLDRKWMGHCYITAIKGARCKRKDYQGKILRGRIDLIRLTLYRDRVERQ